MGSFRVEVTGFPRCRKGRTSVRVEVRHIVRVQSIQRSENGHVGSIRMLLYHENFVKPYSEEHLLVHLLTSPMLSGQATVLPIIVPCFFPATEVKIRLVE